jgi:hypothetical protein
MHPSLSWTWLANSLRIEAGQQFMPSRHTVGTTTVGSWRVIDVFQAADGRSYARVANALDPSRVKTFAQTALLDRKLFQRIG